MSTATKPQLEALRRMAASDEPLIPAAGGFWTTRGTRVEPSRGFHMNADLPTWKVTTLTVRALERRGWIARANVHAEAWRDERTITAAGRAAIANQEA